MDYPAFSSIVVRNSAGVALPTYIAPLSNGGTYLVWLYHRGGSAQALPALESLAADRVYAQSTSALPALVGASTGREFEGHLFFEHTAPPQLFSARGGGQCVIAQTGAFTALAQQGLFAGTSRGSLSAHAKRDTATAFEGTAVAHLSAQGSGGGSRLTAPAGVLSAQATVMGMAYAALVAPQNTLVASGAVSAMGRAALVGQRGVVSARSGGRMVASLIRQHVVNASGTLGSVARASLVGQRGVVSAHGAPINAGRAELIGANPYPTNSGRAELAGVSGIILSSGAPVVTATYAAYAVNLLDKLDRDPRQPEYNEVTKYTNFAFRQIVRFNGGYYGVRADGLFLLGGDTDIAQPIPWQANLCITDFGTKQMKRTGSVYVGGRVEEGMTISVATGEQTDVTYTYATTRGRGAQNHRALFGKGLRARYYSFGLGDAQGRAAKVSSLDFEVDVLERAI